MADALDAMNSRAVIVDIAVSFISSPKARRKPALGHPAQAACGPRSRPFN
jgi:hypothetical protein